MQLHYVDPPPPPVGIVAHLIESLLFGVTPVDLPTYVLTLGVLIGVALCACTIPAVRAIRVNPVTALREQ